MKKVLILAATAAIIVLASCNKAVNEHSPSITFGNITVNNKTIEDNILYVGDTVKIPLMLEPYNNRLTNFNVVADRAFLKDSVFSDADFARFCDTAASDRADGRYVFSTLGDGVALIINPLYIIAKQSPNSDTKTVLLQLQVKNSSSYSGEYNPVTYNFLFKVYEKEENKDEE